MSDVLLSDADQAAFRALVAAEPVPGTPLPSPATLAQLARLIPCDAVGAVLEDADGAVHDAVVAPRGYRHEDGPSADRLEIGFPSRDRRRVLVWLHRRHGRFHGRDVAVLRMLTPALERLLRERPRPGLPASLTEQERRVLGLVAAGCSNAEIAQRMCVATCTVRKHLEHAYRKLGVSNRYAAAAAVRVQPESMFA